ncbi:MAG: amidase domain-containing protein [Candidatus Sericytochromatia bacterium]|nr:amidase domain-containing protein [Candidatus Sericytochromatia bacterium]
MPDPVRPQLPVATGPARRLPVLPPPPVAPMARADRDGDGVIDRYDAAPTNAKDRRWNEVAAREHGAFVKRRLSQLQVMGVEIDCADLAVRLLVDFCKAVGLPSPLGAAAERWYVYTPARPGGLPNVQGPNHFLPGFNADNLAKSHTRPVNDANGNGTAGAHRLTGAVDLEDLRPGDVLFYDWDDDGDVDHTVNVVEVKPDGTVHLAYGTYDNLGTGTVGWSTLDLKPIVDLTLAPNTPDHTRWLGDGNRLWGVRRFNPLPARARAEVVPVVIAPPVPPVEAPAPHGPGGASPTTGAPAPAQPSDPGVEEGSTVRALL